MWRAAHMLLTYDVARVTIDLNGKDRLTDTRSIYFVDIGVDVRSRYGIGASLL